ncbi:hypothetical protein A2165_02425 [Candidatus Curtissbacteria bacterium RBG_13_40_7]|uniref:Polymerase nucleotidyl transferase domain-containing protein n=1 Tax=Candidatus Curtissbacteria bacterium RBG_13_40_7 TaxID=1797706 RepID=A0A1F5FYA1_9BACT|nr:MAG: hypothetical protein A2165_02425 [Candidatus Curtissbacteria bacterium RBG_13_40_7]
MTILSSDQKIINKFLKELVEKITDKYSEDIDFIILFGSAARGEFKRGVSDIDLVIQLKNSQRQKEIEMYSTKIFWELNRKYQTKFERVLSTTKSPNIIDNFFKHIEKGAHLYVPIFVFPPGWLDWEKGRITRLRWRLPSIFFIHQAFIFEKFKEEGKILYGRDVRSLIHPKINFWERWKAIQIPFWLSLFSVAILPFAFKQAVKYAIKAVLYELGSALDFMDIKPKTKAERIKILEKRTTGVFERKFIDFHFKLTFNLLSSRDVGIFSQASQIKSGVLHLTHKDSNKFVVRVFWFVIRTNWSVFLARYFTKKNLISVLVGIITLAIIVYFSISFYALYKLIHPKPKPLTASPIHISQEYEDVLFLSKSGDIKISGWFFKSSKSDKVIILVSGSDQNRIDPGYGTDKVAHDLLSRGFSVLLFDFRGRGNSDYAIYSIGAFERYDLTAAHDYLVRRGYASDSIGIIAISLGAGTAILSLPQIPQVCGIVADSGYADIRTLISRELPGRSRLPKFFSWGISFWARTFYKVKFDELIPTEVIRKFPDKKFLFIHGNKDEDIPIQDSILLSKASPKSELWIVPEAGHVKAYQTAPKEYIRRVTNYFNEVCN